MEVGRLYLHAGANSLAGLATICVDCTLSDSLTLSGCADLSSSCFPTLGSSVILVFLLSQNPKSERVEIRSERYREKNKNNQRNGYELK